MPATLKEKLHTPELRAMAFCSHKAFETHVTGLPEDRMAKGLLRGPWTQAPGSHALVSAVAESLELIGFKML